ncbi:DUF1707 SHOCT-like domain-containing protein [Tessaracoccus caeni]|uniref:DUF1707 SHOCT-like domain-containing protein n=1 Tax=Tessaracoccus caeni TaxID=3031239 RepID=UPI0023D9C7DB|nr:DUF1707 domain-containing protein [Tessaracoccus caeni]MDF1489270.1 DUF1707 domain-containing protein [Tessaracoccus caeni]
MSENYPDAQLRVTASQRDHAAAELREAAADERIDFDELEARLPAVLGARTRGDLIAVLKDLVPAAQMDSVVGADAPLGVGVGFSWEEPWVIQTKWDSVKQIGEWVLPPFTELVSAGATINLNLVKARVLAPVADIVLAGKGTIRIIVPEGWGVDSQGLTADGGQVAGMDSTVRTRPEKGMPRLILRGNFAGAVVVRHPNWWDRRAMRKWEENGRPAPIAQLPAPPGV